MLRKKDIYFLSSSLIFPVRLTTNKNDASYVKIYFKRNVLENKGIKSKKVCSLGQTFLLLPLKLNLQQKYSSPSVSWEIQIIEAQDHNTFNQHLHFWGHHY